MLTQVRDYTVVDRRGLLTIVRLQDVQIQTYGRASMLEQTLILIKAIVN
ncbi:hypothetical protein E3A20_03270 [Planctomyces bekefii]|uniref:Uncharacterized protein n=1 Tax=Planctomyces bekefii TaxID=1653850 RepID=A0A5C6MDE5_9PLAN|nr:hypothetical protein E3A20_03270 [Planctomyces bekefii]